MKRKGLSLILSVIIIFIFVLSPVNDIGVVNAASDKTKIKSTVNSYFKAAKKYDVKKLNKYANDTTSYNPSELNEYSSLRSYLKSSNKSLKYSIKKVSVNNNVASVTLKCKYLDSSTVYEYAFGNILLFSFANIGKNYSKKTLNKKINAIFKESINYSKNIHPKKYKTKTFKINLIKENGNWRIKTVTYDLANSVTANYYKAVETMTFN